MFAILVKALSFVLIIAAGYGLKKVGLFCATDYRIVMKIIMHLTLPAVIITSFDDFSMDPSLMGIILLGLCANLFMAGVGYFMARKMDGIDKAFNILNYSGFNIGCFTMPYVQSFMGSFGVIVTGMFDAGNSIMSTGGTYAVAAQFAGKGKNQSPKYFFYRLFSSIPFDAYMLMLIMAFAGLRFPDFVYDITGTFGSANTFLSMLLIGLIFEFHLDHKKIKRVLTNVGLRFTCATALALVSFFLLPFSEEVRHVLVIVSFSPIPCMAPVFTEKLGGDVSVAGVINSISICISIIVVTTLVAIWHI
ncbi:AEC family transporter [Zongyangia sp. HA2173]|uniref:AEC family transporter n=1 Tax=Zongyangia sp. HA2173 TaxID=3133035 RepID=UPI003162689B